MEQIAEYLDRKRSDSRPTAELIAQLPKFFSERSHATDNPYWDAVTVLHARADDEVIAGMRRFARSLLAVERSIAADVLAQVRVGNPATEVVAGDILIEMAEKEAEIEVLESLGYALGHLYTDGRGIGFLEKLSRRPEVDLRLAAASSLPVAGTNTPLRVVPTLVELSEDVDQDVRNWATFGLGTLIEIDSAEIREALVKRLNDSFGDVRGEALVGLACRADERMIEAFLKEVDANEGVIGKHDLLQDARREILKLAALATSESPWRQAAEGIAISEKFEPV
jgi:HEAT repeat protein